MNKKNPLEILPVNFRHEKIFLIKNNFYTWDKLSKLSNSQINKIINQDQFCTESRLKKIRAIAIFVSKLEITPHQAYLLLHSGISTVETLSNLNPHDVLQKIGRLERKLQAKTKNPIDLLLILSWINRAKKLI